MSPPDPRQPAAGEPVFAEPWQAEAFALVLHLQAAGRFTWAEWAETLGAELKDAGEADDGSRYYERWLAALERLCVGRNLTTPQALAERREAWAQAYRQTPHGQPVRLPNTPER